MWVYSYTQFYRDIPMKTQRLVIEGPLPVIRPKQVMPSFNDFYSGINHAQRSHLKNQWKWLLKSLIQEQVIEPVEDYKVAIRCWATFKKGVRRLDPTNLAGVLKLAEDSLVSEDIIENDSAKYVHHTELGPCLRGPNNCVFIEIQEGVTDETAEEG